MVLDPHSLHVFVSAFCNSVASKAPLPSSTEKRVRMGWRHGCENIILLMEETPNNPWDLKENMVNNGMNYQPQVVIARFLHHQKYHQLALV